MSLLRNIGNVAIIFLRMLAFLEKLALRHVYKADLVLKSE